MPETILRQLCVLWVDKVDGVFRVGPRINQVGARKNFADVPARAGIVDHRVAGFGEADADHEVTAGLAAFPRSRL